MAKLYFRYGSMNSGKSTLLLQTAHNYEKLGMKIIIIKPSIDTKGDNRVVSRIGPTREVDYLVDEDTILYRFVNRDPKPDAILVDEAQFLKNHQVNELYIITKQYNIPVLAYGLRNDFLLQTFEGSARLLALADSIEELKTMCRCGVKATQNIRMINGNPVFEGKSIVIDGKEDITYEAVCGKCYLKKRHIL